MEDILLHLMPFLDLKTVQNCRQVSQKWSKLIDQNKRFWIRVLHALKREKIYFEMFSETVCDIFPDWQKIFEYFEKEVEIDKLREFVCALQAPYEYLRREKDGQRLDEIMNPMHIEALHGRHKLIHILVESPADFNSQTIPNDDEYEDAGNNTVLHIACSNGDIELVKFILSHLKDKNIDLHLRNDRDCTPFHVACIGGELIGPDDKIDQSFGPTFSHKEVIKYFLHNSEEFGIDVNDPGWCEDHPLALLTSWSQNETYSELLEEFVNHKDFEVPDQLVIDSLEGGFENSAHELEPMMVKYLKATLTLKHCLKKSNLTAEETLKRVANELGVDMDGNEEPTKKKSC